MQEGMDGRRNKDAEEESGRGGKMQEGMTGWKMQKGNEMGGKKILEGKDEKEDERCKKERQGEGVKRNRYGNKNYISR